MHTANKVNENFAKLAQLFPNAVTESIVDGEVVRSIDKDVLMQEISANVVEGKAERYQFTWPDKKKSVLLANAPSYKTLRPVIEDETIPTGSDSMGNPYSSSGSVDFDTTENLYIEGDNLDVLKLLQETYLGKIKMIYIDPPYNTGKDFVYTDKFKQSVDEYMDISGELDEEGNRLFTNSETNGRYHTDWLNMMYPRLRLAKDLLKDDGVIFISIDDNEVENLKKICNEVFGEWNFISNIVVESGEAFGAKVTHKEKTLFKVKDYVLIYTKSIVNELIRTPLYDKAKEPYDSHFNCIIDDDLKRIDFISYLKKNVDIVKEFDRFNLDIKKSNITKLMLISDYFRDYMNYKIADKLFKDQQFTLNIPKEVEKLLDENEIVVYEKYLLTKTSGNKIRHYRSFRDTLHFTDEYESTFCRASIRGDLWKNFVKDMGNVAKEGEINFKNGKKPVRLVKQLVKWCNLSSEDIILDFFSGSATTAHAVMQLNAEDGGNRKFICVQLPELIEEKHEAYKAGYRNICEIGKERIRRAGVKIKEENRAKEGIDKLDTGFRVFKVDTSNMKDIYYEPNQVTQSLLDMYISNVKEDRNQEDLLFQVMLDLGILLSNKIETEIIEGKKIFTVYQGDIIYLIACFENDINTDVVTDIAKRKPYYAVFKDQSMENDSLMNSFEQIFKAYSKDTIRKVI